ncbi:MAG: hypothetical protein H6559_26910 [Lewinellaceae bacterium]|nr:hypothetical protein [Lewinellaceae bacterium]
MKQDNNEIVYGGEPVNPDRIYRFGRLDALGRQDEQDEQVLAAPGPQTFSEQQTANSEQQTGGYPVQVDRMNRMNRFWLPQAPRHSANREQQTANSEQQTANRRLPGPGRQDEQENSIRQYPPPFIPTHKLQRRPR